MPGPRAVTDPKPQPPSPIRIGFDPVQVDRIAASTQSPGLPAPQPLLIDAAGHTCVAWWHAPAARPGALSMAVVLASSWGEEDMAGYDGQRALAIALAEGGLGTLRFEWPDTGDSSAATGSTCVADALAAFDAAARQALALSGCGRLAFAGLGLGALLAAHAAAARDDVEALVGLAPAGSGRAFVRGQRLRGTGLAAHVPLLEPGGTFDAAHLGVQLGGFTQSVRHVEALSALKWPTGAAPSLRDALLLGSCDAPGSSCADALGRMGVRVHEWVHADPSDAAAVAHAPPSLAPLAIAEIRRWLQERAGDASLAAAGLEAATGRVLALAAAGAGARAWMALRVDGVAVRERVVHIGNPGAAQPPCLVGVLAELDERPGAHAGRAPRRALVLLSSGSERRVGPHRLWVDWARRRAALGDVVLRVDIAGIGDSARRLGQHADGIQEQDDPHAIDDLGRALAWLRREHGAGACTVMGIRSGAYHAWRGTLQGLDIQQMVALNPPAFHAAEARSPDPGGRGIGRIARLLRWPLRYDLGADLARASDRGVALDFVFSGQEPGLALLREESGRRGLRLVRERRVNVSVVAHADATFAGTAGREALYARLDSLLPAAADA
jgi:alpha/beta superfamily hydrolase